MCYNFKLKYYNPSLASEYIFKIVGVVSYLLVCCLPVIASQAPSLSSSSQTKTEIENQRKESENNEKKTLDPDAIAAIEETRKAIQAIKQGQDKEALSSIEHATGKIDILIARHPKDALIPARFNIEVVDNAPTEVSKVRTITKALERAIRHKDFTESRFLLDLLKSEIIIRTYHLPLAFYPASLKNAARLLDQGKRDEAQAELETALNTQVRIDKSLPIPIISAQAKIKEAEKKQEENKDIALNLLQEARLELDLAKELGYAGMDEDYAALNKMIEDIEKQIKSKESTGHTFSSLHEKLKSFLQRQSASQKPSHNEVEEKK